MKKAFEVITKGELKFWLMIGGIIIAGVLRFSLLENKVQAMVSREQANRTQFFQVVKSMEEIKATVIEISVNQKHIMRELGIEVK